MRYRIIILSVLGALVIISLLVFVFGRKPSTVTTAKLTFWGLDDPADWTPILQAYKAANPGITVNYVQKNASTYEKDFINALASGAGPDIVYINNTWTNKHLAKLSPAPAALMPLQTFKDTFMDVAASDLIKNNQIYALPLYVDTLALYYNKSLFNNAGIVSSPRTWDEFDQDVAKLVQKNANGDIGRAGAALGTASNVEHASDILSLLMMQTGATMIDPQTNAVAFDKSVNLNGQGYSPGLAALDFYTNFANSTKPFYTWNARQPDSLVSFSAGKSAMYIGYAKDLPAILKSGLSFAVGPIPQIKDTLKDSSYLNVNLANYSAVAVTQISLNKSVAWDFLNFSTAKNASSNYLFYAKLPTARKDLVDFQSSDPTMAVFAKQGLSAFSWPQPDEVAVNQVFSKMIDSVALGQAASADAIKEAAIEIGNLLK